MNDTKSFPLCYGLEQNNVQALFRLRRGWVFVCGLNNLALYMYNVKKRRLPRRTEGYTPNVTYSFSFARFAALHIVSALRLIIN
jgi:hypothetical protein